ncbi:MAG TPA: hypothetical protein VG498_18175 [Terriglobales bacterium]|nr:hypothetical protein [Terriglobales bacterium]
MNDIDEQLRSALRRCDPSAGFADRVLAMADKEQKRSVRSFGQFRLGWPALRWAAIPTLAAILIAGFAYRAYEQRKEDAEARAARQQVLLALRITGSKLRLAKQKVKRVEMREASSEKKL